MTAGSTPISAGEPFGLGRWRIDPVAREATDGATVHRLSPRAMKALSTLIEAKGAVVSRAVLMDVIWPGIHVGEESLSQAITELRRALGDGRRAPAIIETIPKAGYRLVAPVHSDPPTLADDFDLDAYLLCLEARRLSARGGAGHVEQAEAIGLAAVARAPRFALARAEYALAIAFRALYRRGNGPGLADAAEQAGMAACIRPDLTFGHAVNGYVLGAMGRVTAAREAFTRALSLDATDYETHYLCARMLFASGNGLAATGMAERAATLRPDDYRPLLLASRAAFSAGKLLRGQASARQGLARVNAKLRAEPDEPRALNALAPLIALSGDTDGAMEAMREDEARGGTVEFYNVVAAATAGAVTTALDRLEEMADTGWCHGDWLRAEPFAASLRGIERFDRLSRSLGPA